LKEKEMNIRTKMEGGKKDALTDRKKKVTPDSLEGRRHVFQTDYRAEKD